MQHSSIFQPLHTNSPQQAPLAMELEECLLQAPAMAHLPTSAAFAPTLFSISPPSPPSSCPPSPNAFHTHTHLLSPFDHTSSCSLHAGRITSTPPSPSHCKKATSVQDFASSGVSPLSHPILAATQSPPGFNGSCALISPPTTQRALSPPSPNGDIDGHTCADDGSVASKLLSSITKSISSPSLHLSSCKEAPRETSYQKTLKLKNMKLHHCAEALGMESSDNSSFFYDSRCIHPEKEKDDSMISNPPISCPPSASFTLPNSHQESSLKSVKSSPNLSANHFRYTRSTSFPPPLSHTLPTFSSYDSLSLSLHAYREGGHFILKETMVPSKHYFHASRGNGRLTLYVLTRGAEEEESVDDQDDNEEEMSNKECHHAEREEHGEAIEDDVDTNYNKEHSSNTIQSLHIEEECVRKQSLDVEEECVRKNLGMVDIPKEERLNGLSCHNNNKGNIEEDGTDDDKRNGDTMDSNGQLLCGVLQPSSPQSSPIIYSHVDSRRSDVNGISNVITLSLQSFSHSKLTLHKSQVLSFPYLSSYPLLSGTLKQSVLIHSSDHGSLPSKKVHDHVSTLKQSNENFIWESDLTPCAVVLGNLRPRTVVQRSGSAPCKQRHGCGGQRGGGCGGGGAVLPAFVMEEMSAKSLRKMVSKLATSSIVEATYGGRNWCLGGSKKKPLITSGESGTIFGGYASARRGTSDEGESDTIFGGYASARRGASDEGEILTHGANFGDECQLRQYGATIVDGHITTILDEEEKGVSEMGIRDLNMRPSPLHFSPSNANFQCELEWLHTLHCKELFDRHQIGQSFRKLHCIPTRS